MTRLTRTAILTTGAALLVAVVARYRAEEAHLALAAPPTSSGGASYSVQAGQTYRILVGASVVQFKVLEVGKAGQVKVQAVEDAEGIGINPGSVWWLNLNQILLIQAK